MPHPVSPRGEFCRCHFADSICIGSADTVVSNHSWFLLVFVRFVRHDEVFYAESKIDIALCCFALELIGHDRILKIMSPER